MFAKTDKRQGARDERRRKAVAEVLDGIETGGMPGLFKSVYRMIGENQPSIDCVLEAEQPFGADAPSGGEDAQEIFGDNTWDAALDFAACLRDAILEPEPPEPPEPPEGTNPPTPPPHGLKDNVADIVLAALLVRLRSEEKAKRQKVTAA